MTSRAAVSFNVESLEQDNSVSSITMVENTLHVIGANGQMLKIYNVAGICVLNFKVEGMDKRFDLPLPKGVYIVKIGKIVRKISVK
ncbi:MAG: T9SS type A sorting domain-containing protein [Prevotella sp.]